ncbi:hypothetical protein GH714_011657 [Hevea brasiliensis]|uniref:Uncharacterized protein n=1 Tax=Hevea brasiliensis TaxID=3981 RepID=A0A6A6MWX9_HEVBR|nr:hypothetical protein GH714_011657 [Hevea brasiliensis]
MVARFPARNLVMGEVKILKRGESLAKSDNRVPKENRKPRVKKEKNADLVLGCTDRLGPTLKRRDPEAMLSPEEYHFFDGKSFGFWQEDVNKDGCDSNTPNKERKIPNLNEPRWDRKVRSIPPTVINRAGTAASPRERLHPNGLSFFVPYLL